MVAGANEAHSLRFQAESRSQSPTLVPNSVGEGDLLQAQAIPYVFSYVVLVLEQEGSCAIHKEGRKFISLGIFGLAFLFFLDPFL